jgi:predicted Rossmann fold nucleotide-binding protein DprA/Smf involved in DNA uptake
MAERLAVVGTRSVTPEMGRFVTDKVVAALESGATIVSGGSTGVDYIAARAVYNPD